MSRLGAAFTWLGHSAFHIQAEPDGPGILIDPWLENPKAPADAAQFADSTKLILVTHAHSDHYGNTVEIAKRTGATVIASYELAAELAADGVPNDQLVNINRGGSTTVLETTVTLVQAVHSSSVTMHDGRMRSVGEPCGFIIELANGTVIYNTGDTAVFGDMALIAEIYRPKVLMLSIGDFYTMGARQAAKAIELVKPAWIIPQHYGTFDGLPGTPDALRELLPHELRDRLLVPAVGVTIR